MARIAIDAECHGVVIAVQYHLTWDFGLERAKGIEPS
jgi:hypothetical protein